MSFLPSMDELLAKNRQCVTLSSPKTNRKVAPLQRPPSQRPHPLRNPLASPLTSKKDMETSLASHYSKRDMQMHSILTRSSTPKPSSCEQPAQVGGEDSNAASEDERAHHDIYNAIASSLMDTTFVPVDEDILENDHNETHLAIYTAIASSLTKLP